MSSQQAESKACPPIQQEAPALSLVSGIVRGNTTLPTLDTFLPWDSSIPNLSLAVTEGAEKGLSYPQVRQEGLLGKAPSPVAVTLPPFLGNVTLFDATS